MLPSFIPFLDRFFNWMVVALSYYGISYSAGSIGDDLFVSNILIALVGKKIHPENSLMRRVMNNPSNPALSS